MKSVLQRVRWARVSVDGKTIAEIGPGLLNLIGFEKGDDAAEIPNLMQKIRDMRVFADEKGKMNLSLMEIGGGHLLVSQFTLAAQWGSGRRPSFDRAETPARARELYEMAVRASLEAGMPTQTGEFAADMKIELLNDGPVTFIL